MSFYDDFINLYFPVFLIIITLSLTIDLVKILFKNKLSKYWEVDDERLKTIKQSDQFYLEYCSNPIEYFHFKYKYQEYKLMFYSGSIYLIILFSIIKLYFPNFYSYLKTQKYSYLNLIYRILITIFINMTLYLGNIVQIINGNEKLGKVPIFIYFIEQIYSPILEESVFRGIIMNIFRYNGYSNLFSGFMNSILFGIIHFRHLFDKYIINKPLNLIIFQSLYTSFFGFYSSYIYNYSNCIISSIILHGTCNLLSFPKLNYLKDKRISEDKKYFFSFCFIFGILGFIFEIYYFR
jgi:membrane protease YdiL (CAAX protease family)